MTLQNAQKTQKGMAVKHVPVRHAGALLFASLVLFAATSFAQSWPPRLISRTTDVSQISTVDAVEWFSGEQVEYQHRGYIGTITNRAVYPTNAVAIWFVTDATYTNYFVIWTNSAISNATGFLGFTLPTPFAALTSSAEMGASYESWVNVYGGAPTNGSTPIGVVDRMQIIVKRGASYSGAYRGPSTITNAILNGNTQVEPGFWALHSNDINAVISEGSGSSTNVIFENLDGNGDVGTNSDQVALGSHGHRWTEISDRSVSNADLAAGAVSSTKVTDEIQYVTNGASVTINIPDATGVWYHVGTVSPVSRVVYLRLRAVVGGGGVPANMTIRATRDTAAVPELSVPLNRASSTNFGFGGIGADSSGNVYVQLTNNTGGVASSTALSSAGECPEFPDAAPIIGAITNVPIDSVASIVYFRPGTAINYSPRFVGDGSGLSGVGVDPTNKVSLDGSLPMSGALTTPQINSLDGGYLDIKTFKEGGTALATRVWQAMAVGFGTHGELQLLNYQGQKLYSIDTSGHAKGYFRWIYLVTNKDSGIVGSLTPTGGLKIGENSFEALPSGDIRQDYTNSAKFGAITAASAVVNGEIRQSPTNSAKLGSVTTETLVVNGTITGDGSGLSNLVNGALPGEVNANSNNAFAAGTTQTMDIVKFTGGFILGNVLVTNVSTNAGSSAYTNTFTGQGTTGAVTSTSSDTGKFLNAVGQMVTPGYPTGVGGGTNGLVLIASYVADDTTNRVEFSAIPQTYKALLLIGGLWERGEATWDSGSVNGAPIVLRVNNNTNAVYDWSRTFITGNARTDGTLNNYPYIYASYGTSTTNGWCSFRTRFNNYTLAGVAKAIDSEWTVAAYASPPTMTYLAGEFRGGVREMNAMTSLVVYAISTTNWSRGRLDLYGVQ